jgi:hypothetical protein
MTFLPVIPVGARAPVSGLTPDRGVYSFEPGDFDPIESARTAMRLGRIQACALTFNLWLRTFAK